MTDIVERLQSLAEGMAAYENGDQPWAAKASSKMMIEAADEIKQLRKRLYTMITDNHPTIHSNRFPAWDELSEAEKVEALKP